MHRCLPAIAACLALGACAAAPVETVSAPMRPAATRAELVALAMEDAAAAEATGDAQSLARALRVVEAAGARPLEGASEDPVPAWRNRAEAAGTEADPPLRGRPLGPGYRSGRIAAGGRDSFAQLFLSGTASTIALSAPTGDRVALAVLDQQDKPVCKRDAASSGSCRWVPLFTQRYKIEVQNLGPSDARYFLVVE